MCVRELKGKPSLWPDGIPALPKGMGYTLYGPFFCPDSVYGAKFPMENSTDGHNAEPAPDAAEAFYSSLFSDQLQKGVPMTGSVALPRKPFTHSVSGFKLGPSTHCVSKNHFTWQV